MTDSLTQRLFGIDLWLVGAAHFVILFASFQVPYRLRWKQDLRQAFHRAFTNRIASRFADRLPGFAIVSNVGRKSGTLYRTPVNVFRKPDGFLIALTYGRDSGWVKNVLAAGGCHLETRRVPYQLSTPIIVHDPSRRRFPLLVRVILGLIGANDFLQLSTSHAHGAYTNYAERY